ncbi:MULTISPECIES: histone-like nucleoid-structuring protein Lsr2 [unclassified Leucobacter]|uniref:histone-like nucleoid-structuring protein Lsr2 n=1 Tax=unclassified Leucobacter TaxID=2621730 RepID=UPI000621642C|nr:Lsr2 family protein [Leucobacter sp. Ag1]KKI18455.1 hypothetical protein XM48_11305 [Leucobacter sp. Ag1]
MAKRITEILVDDLDGTELTDGAGETVRFSLDGTAYEIDLSEAHATELREAFAPFVKVARKASSAARGRTAQRSSRGSSNASAVREWLREQGHEVPDRGRIPGKLLAIYEAAQG